MVTSIKPILIFNTVLFAGLLTACSDDSETQTESAAEFALQFKAMSGEQEVNCDTLYTGFGPDETISVGVTDLRFYVSNLKFYDANGEVLDVTLHDNDFQLNHEAGSVALVDLTGTDSGYCAMASEGTPRTNAMLTGTKNEANISAVSFDVGVPQGLMKAVIDNTDVATDSPPPLAEMYWSWASGYRHFVLNFNAMDSANTNMAQNSGFHIGSRNCGSAAKALADQDECGVLNTAKVSLAEFDPSINTVTVDLQALFVNTVAADFNAPNWAEFGDDDSVCIDEKRNGNRCVIGTNFGLQCHSGVSQGACQSLFPNFGLNLDTGEANSSTNIVFGKE